MGIWKSDLYHVWKNKYNLSFCVRFSIFKHGFYVGWFNSILIIISSFLLCLDRFCSTSPTQDTQENEETTAEFPAPPNTHEMSSPMVSDHHSEEITHIPISLIAQQLSNGELQNFDSNEYKSNNIVYDFKPRETDSEATHKTSSMSASSKSTKNSKTNVIPNSNFPKIIETPASPLVDPVYQALQKTPNRSQTKTPDSVNTWSKNHRLNERLYL